MTFRKILTGLAILVIAQTLVPCIALSSVCGSAQHKTYVFFGNGMNNDPGDAEDSRRTLQKNLVRRGGLNEDEWTFELSYNHDETVLDLLEVYRQREGEATTAFWRWLGNHEIAPDWFQQAVEQSLATYSRAEAVIDSDLRNHVQRYRAVLLEGNRILVVAHSQGNLYANLAYDNLRSDPTGLSMSSFGIVSVANPSNRVAGNGPYYTRLDDRVILLVSLLYLDTLPANSVNTNEDHDWLHHNFIDAYLNGNMTGPSILDTTLANANALSWHPQRVQGGPITVTLTWGAQPDVDLHVYEPNGTHVYYGNRIGPSGYLDRDDVTSYGPEHYYVVSCDTLEAGTYRIALDYYRGYGPEVANIQIEAGLSVRTFQEYLPSSSYGTPSSPVAIARVEVTPDPNGGYEFQIAEQ